MPYTGTPATFTAGAVLTAAQLNSNLRDFARGFTDAWTSYTPTLTASTTNPTNWTQTGYYMRVGKLVQVKGTLTAGASMTAGNGTYRIALPANANTALANAVVNGSFYIYDNSTGAGHTISIGYVAAAGYISMLWSTGAAPSFVTHAMFGGFAANDFIQFAFSYEAA